jgi:hypothetical protein
MPDCASYGSADCSMMPGDMSGHPASNRALGTALGVGWYRRQRNEKRQSAGQYDFHQLLLSCRRLNACCSLSFLCVNLKYIYIQISAAHGSLTSERRTFWSQPIKTVIGE